MSCSIDSAIRLVSLPGGQIKAHRSAVGVQSTSVRVLGNPMSGIYRNQCPVTTKSASDRKRAQVLFVIASIRQSGRKDPDCVSARYGHRFSANPFDTRSRNRDRCFHGVGDPSQLAVSHLNEQGQYDSVLLSCEASFKAAWNAM